MYQELSGENINGYENELDEKLEGTLALKLDCEKRLSFRKGVGP